MPSNRAKPFGTGHAILCAKNAVKTPFCVINADDYYGNHAFFEIEKYLEQVKEKQYSMVTYELGKTLSKNGTVTRGVCSLENGYLKTIEEVSKIDSEGNCIYKGKEQKLDGKTPVSMNLWGLSLDIFNILEKEWNEFLNKADLTKDEFLIPTIIGDSINKYGVSVKAFSNKDKWYGITYKEDLDEVKDAIKTILKEDIYKF